MRTIKNFPQLVLILLGHLCFFSLSAQEHFTSGFLIMQNNDSVYGYIGQVDWAVNPSAIEFKTAKDQSPETLGPTKVKEFRAGDNYYVSAVVPVEAPDQKISVDTVFLQVLVAGRKSLYRYKNAQGEESFFIGPGYEWLVSNENLDKTGPVGKGDFRDQLADYLGGCSNALRRVKKTVLTQKSLTYLFQDYYACSTDYLSYQKKTDVLHTDFGALAGVSSTRLTFSNYRKSGGYPGIENAGYQVSVNPAAGVYMDVVLPWNRGKWSVYNELFFSTYRLEGSYTDVVNEDVYYRSDTELGYSYLKLNNMVRFKCPVGPMSLFLNGGFSNGIAIHEINKNKRTSHIGQEVQHYTGHAIGDTRLHERGFILGSGMQYQRISLEFRFELGDGMEVYSSFESRTKRYFVLVGYRF